MKEALKKRTKLFAHNCIKITQQLPNNYLANHIKGQLIRCSTSVAANFWLEFTLDENLIQKNNIEKLLKESSELTAIFMGSRKTASRK
ncbi:four helix bundle protein [Jejuia pallidilutea]|uniref:four helix bundle protein n=1 Tax=Jejuia pallidilutea TaxID=504487 RepID=UPI0005AA1E78|nr:four helix bundle protein [Jejuia pallidilutea]